MSTSDHNRRRHDKGATSGKIKAKQENRAISENEESQNPQEKNDQKGKSKKKPAKGSKAGL